MLSNGSCRDYTEYKCVVHEVKFAEEILGQLKEIAAGGGEEE